ncbi:uncharacterized protein LOC131876007 [Cryptomeria japonica]|uniref:uncharacterized protein LOC131876007 n=1 Tax=Cryptomeria japonica TaxID=3369 RepID=UPI0027DA3B4E|nr:uncharacterized protein LOC131876007 [Cryptomeria japonica]
MCFAASLQGTRAYWKRSRKDLTIMIHQLGAPTLFFTLSAADTKWPELHKLFPPNLSPEFQSTKKQFIENIIHNPHVTSLFLHFRFTIFHEEIIDKLLRAKYHWYRYEWKHRGSAHMHGFLWLPNAPDMDNLDLSNHDNVQSTKSFFDRYVTAWNPRNQVAQANRLHTASLFDPRMANTNQILYTNPLSDYEELINVVQQHTKCSTHTCLKKKGSTLHCRYRAPWPEQDFSTLIVDTDHNPSYEPARNDSHLNIHSPIMLAIWRANVDCQPNIRNANPLQTDWEALMSRSSSKLPVDHNKHFDNSIHLFAKNASVKHHNTKMLKQLHLPIARCLAQVPKQMNIAYDNDEQLPSELLLSLNEQVMLISNLWIQVGLVNGSLGQIKSIVYDTDSKPPDLPKYVVVEFKNYSGPHWDNVNPKFVPIPPITQGSRTQLPLAMAWALTIPKSQGLTLDKATVNIGKAEKTRANLHCTVMSEISS